MRDGDGCEEIVFCGEYEFEMDNQCHKCSFACLYCTDAESCDVCDEGYDTDDYGVCIKACAENEYEQDNECIYCGLGCMHCMDNENCEECEEGFELDNGVCSEIC